MADPSHNETSAERLRGALAKGDIETVRELNNGRLDPVNGLVQQPQRQDSLDDQLRDVRRAAVKLGCYDAADWIRSRTL